MVRLYETEEEIEAVVRGFETCRTPAGEFHHREHLTVAVWYLERLSREEALERMRAALLRFIDHHGVDPKKYNEEVTVFWIREIADHLDRMKTDVSLVEKCNEVIVTLGSASSRDRV